MKAHGKINLTGEGNIEVVTQNIGNIENYSYNLGVIRVDYSGKGKWLLPELHGKAFQWVIIIEHFFFLISESDLSFIS